MTVADFLSVISVLLSQDALWLLWDEAIYFPNMMNKNYPCLGFLLESQEDLFQDWIKEIIQMNATALHSSSVHLHVCDVMMSNLHVKPTYTRLICIFSFQAKLSIIDFFFATKKKTLNVDFSTVASVSLDVNVVWQISAGLAVAFHRLTLKGAINQRIELFRKWT